jgi:hypothetical protein
MSKTMTELFNEGQPETPALPWPNKPDGVGGWLAWLTFSLLFLSPALSAFLAYSSTLTSKPPVAPELWTTVLHTVWVPWGVRTVLCLLMGLLLLKRLRRSTRFIVMVLLWVGVLLPEAVSYAIVAIEQPSWVGAIAPGIGQEIGQMVIPTLIWTIYLGVSKRVQNTYL